MMRAGDCVKLGIQARMLYYRAVTFDSVLRRKHLSTDICLPTLAGLALL